MMQHLLTAIGEWAWSAFGYERLWGSICEWLMQRARPEAFITLSMRALQMSLRHLSRTAQCMSEDGKPVSLNYNVISFDRATNDLIIPSYLKSALATAIKLSDGGKTFSVRPLPARHVKQALQHVSLKLHQFFLRWPGLCCPCSRSSDCLCRDYRTLWQVFFCLC